MNESARIFNFETQYIDMQWVIALWGWDPLLLAPIRHYIFHIYSRPPLHRLRLSRITAYLEEKIWSLFWHRHLTSGSKILWIRGEIAPQEQFLPFSTIFQHIFLTKGAKLHVNLWNLIVRLVFSSILHIWYVEVRISRNVSEGLFDLEITRVDYSFIKEIFFQLCNN